MSDLSSVSAIFFDFDGVIMDSMHLKLEAYLRAVERFGFEPSEVDRLMRVHMGQSRQRILRWMYEDLSGEAMPDDVFEEVLAVFNAHDDAFRVRMEYVPGSREFLEKVHSRFYTAVITGTPEDVILKTTAHFELDGFFDVVRGSPDRKIDIAAELLERNGLDPATTLFVGDGKTDQEAAEANGLRFVGRGTKEISFDPDRAWRVVEDLNELLD